MKNILIILLVLLATSTYADDLSTLNAHMNQEHLRLEKIRAHKAKKAKESAKHHKLGKDKARQYQVFLKKEFARIKIYNAPFYNECYKKSKSHWMKKFIQRNGGKSKADLQKLFQTEVIQAEMKREVAKTVEIVLEKKLGLGVKFFNPKFYKRMYLKGKFRGQF